jgi:hypothetical protein
LKREVDRNRIKEHPRMRRFGSKAVKIMNSNSHHQKSQSRNKEKRSRYKI